MDISPETAPPGAQRDNTNRIGDSTADWHAAAAPATPLGDRTALVVGASRGIGAAVAEILVADGARVVLGGRHLEPLVAKADALRERWLDAHVTAAVCDVLDEAQVHEVMTTAAGSDGVLDILVLAAGITGPIETPVTELSVEDFREVMDVNVTGTFVCCRAAVPFLRRAQAGGRIVTFSSTAGLRGYSNRVGYSASKWAIRGLTRALARELGPLDITVNSVAPYTVHGNRMADVVEGKAARQRTTPEQVYADFARQTALGRWIDESDVAETIRFLVSDGARNITGQNIAIDAGWDA